MGHCRTCTCEHIAIEPHEMHEMRKYPNRVFDAIFGHYKKERRGNHMSTRIAYRSNIDLDDRYALYNITHAYNCYVLTSEYKDGIVMGLAKWFEQWENFVPDDLYETELNEDDLEEFEQFCGK